MNAAQYATLKRIFGALLSGNGYASPAATESVLFSFFNQLSNESIGSSALTAQETAALQTVFRSQLADSGYGVPNAPSSSELADFFTQLATDSANSAALPLNQYQLIRSALKATLSDNGLPSGGPTDSKLLSLVSSLNGVTGDAPALFISGQSNAGNQDATTGPTDARVSLTWTADGSSFTGPSGMALQSGGHSHEWSCAYAMAQRYKQNIIVGKTWGDGTSVSFWKRTLMGNIMWPRMAKMLVNFGLQCQAAGKTQVAFIWDQGEAESSTANSAQTPSYGSDTLRLMASIRAVLGAFGIARVRFFLIKINADIVNFAGVDATLLASVRSQQLTVAATDPDCEVIDCDDIVPPGHLHYSGGQTLTIGTRVAGRIAATFTTTQPAAAAPYTVSSLFGAALKLDLDARSGVTGNPVTAWNDVSGGGWTSTMAGTARPAFLASVVTVNGVAIPALQFDGVANKAVLTGPSLPDPATTKTWMFAVMRQDTWAFNNRWISNTAGKGIFGNNPSPSLNTNDSGAGTALAVTEGVLGTWEAHFANSAAGYANATPGDFQRFNDVVVGGNAGTGALGNMIICNGATTQFGAFTVSRVLFTSQAPSDSVDSQLVGSQRDRFLGYCLATYGTTMGLF